MNSKQKNKTHNDQYYIKRKKTLEPFNGKYNGWWYYQYFKEAVMKGNYNE